MVIHYWQLYKFLILLLFIRTLRGYMCFSQPDWFLVFAFNRYKTYIDMNLPIFDSIHSNLYLPVTIGTWSHELVFLRSYLNEFVCIRSYEHSHRALVFSHYIPSKCEPHDWQCWTTTLSVNYIHIYTNFNKRKIN